MRHLVVVSSSSKQHSRPLIRKANMTGRGKPKSKAGGSFDAGRPPDAEELTKMMNELKATKRAAEMFKSEGQKLKTENQNIHGDLQKLSDKAKKNGGAKRKIPDLTSRSDQQTANSQGEKETPIQKYQRLQCEMNHLLEEVNNLNKNKHDNQLDCLIPTEQVEQSLKLLADLKLEETLGEELIAKISDPEGAQIQKLLAQLKQFKQNIDERPESSAYNEGDGIVYQFNYRPEQAKLKQTARVAELESRLHRLESVIGVSSDKLSRLTTATNKGSLLEAAQYLSATASLLDSSHLDHIEGRLSGLSHKLKEIAERKKELQQDEEKDKMILELYEHVKNSENMNNLLPQTIERLKSLEALHNKATEFTKTLTQIELAQAEINSNVQNNKTLLQGVQESFAMNLNEINQSVMSLDARIKALKKK